jgi:hypothetical protein
MLAACVAPPYYFAMGDIDASEKALVEKATESELVRGEDLLDSADLKRKLDDAKKALRPEMPEGDPSDAPKP